MSEHRPVLGLLVGPDPPPGIAALLSMLDRWCTPRAADPATDAPAAWFATSPRAPRLAMALASNRPVAVWVNDDKGAQAMAAHERVIVVGAADAGSGGPSLDLRRYPYVAPFVRARKRVAARLPTAYAVTVGTADADVRDDELSRVLPLASSVAVVGPALAEALAWGAPCVTDASSAAALGASDGLEVVITDESRFRAAAAELADDPRRAALLSRAGRLLMERRDRTGRVRGVARRLGLLGTGPEGVIGERLEELFTPVRARIRDRVDDALADLVRSA